MQRINIRTMVTELPIKVLLMQRDGLSELEAIEVMRGVRQAIADGENASNLFSIRLGIPCTAKRYLELIRWLDAEPLNKEGEL